MLQIYHNARCSKSRTALAKLVDSGIEYEIVDYLTNPPSVAELRTLVSKLDMKPFDLIRKSESVFAENYKGKELSDEEWLLVMHQHPILIERPILVSEGFARIARSEEVLCSVIAK